MKETIQVCGMIHEKSLPVNIHYHKGNFPMHLHSHWEIAINIDADSIHIVDGESYFLSKNHAILIKPSNNHKIVNNSSKIHTSLVFEISKEFFISYCKIIDDTLYERLSNSSNIVTKIPNSLIEKIINFISSISINSDRLSNENNQSNVRNLACLLLSYLIFNQSNILNVLENNLTSNIPIVSQFFNIIQAPENINLSYNQICNKLNYSEGHIIRVFKQNNLNTPNVILTKYKLSYACKLLDTTTLNIDDICEKIGFSSYSYFNKIFKKEFGLSPSEFRKRIIHQ